MKSFIDYTLDETKRIKDMDSEELRAYETEKRNKASSRGARAYDKHDSNKKRGIEKPKPQWHKDMKAKAQAKKDDRAAHKSARAGQDAEKKAVKDRFDKSKGKPTRKNRPGIFRKLQLLINRPRTHGP